jgi:hypothetical protein
MMRPFCVSWGTASLLLGLCSAACGGSEFSANTEPLNGGTGGARSAGAGGRDIGGTGAVGGASAGGTAGVTAAGGGLSGDSGSPGLVDARAPDGGASGGAGAGGAPACDQPTTWYRDDDGDGYGRSTDTLEGCGEPPAGHYAAAGGDCNDDNGDVHPKQDAFFDKPYKTAGNGESYDYDCSGTEDGDAAQTASGGSCSLNLGSCNGTGYASGSRSGSGVNPTCGSHGYQTCKLSSPITCQSTTTDKSDGYRCH